MERPGGLPMVAVRSANDRLTPAGRVFTQGWFTCNVPVWKKVLAPLVGKPVHALEIGVFEGRSTVWPLENVLTHPEATLTWIDTFAGWVEHTGTELSGLEARFRENVARLC